ncbi:MAG TPA: serine/threonine-protein kinase, partial [Thermoanaerobaculia bacterium]|nr:serine/threonine-protein kinase [Thermoanaerobaculia bacterium]
KEPASSGGLPVGSRLAGRYEILAEIGHGGMGRVYRAHDHDLGEVVAIKTVLTSSEGGAGEETRLLREIQICRRISHPNVVRVHDLGRFDRGLFVTMEYLEGDRLDQVIERELPLPFSRIRTLLSEAAAGLQEAHRQGVVHRDLKPGNLMVTANRLKILDFGIASMRGLSGRLTQVGMVLGSPMYMSPEQIRGQQLDGRSDLYSLGLIAYALITGGEPFELNEPTVLVLQKLREDPPDIRTARPDTPESWAALVMRLLARDREDRFADAGELLAALAKLPVASTNPRSTMKIKAPEG